MRSLRRSTIMWARRFLAKLNLSTFDLVPDDERERVKNSMELLSQAIDKLRDISSTLNEENITNFSLLNSPSRHGNHLRDRCP